MKLLHILFGTKDEFNRPVDNEYFFDQMEKVVVDIAEANKNSLGILENVSYDIGKFILIGTNSNIIGCPAIKLTIHRKTFFQKLGAKVGYIKIHHSNSTGKHRSGLYDRYGLLESSRDKFDWSLFDFYLTAIDPHYVD